MTSCTYKAPFVIERDIFDENARHTNSSFIRFTSWPTLVITFITWDAKLEEQSNKETDVGVTETSEIWPSYAKRSLEVTVFGLKHDIS